jgi:hypothetical protein
MSTLLDPTSRLCYFEWNYLVGFMVGRLYSGCRMQRTHIALEERRLASTLGT